MKYSRSALGLLNAQYKSVLKKCLLINLGLFALGMGNTQAEIWNYQGEGSYDVGLGRNDYEKSIDQITDVTGDLTVSASSKSEPYSYILNSNGVGAFYVRSGVTGSIQVGSIQNASAASGGAVYVENGAVLNNLQAGDGDGFRENKATAGNGGAIYNAGEIKAVNVQSVSAHIMDNTASGNGGAIYNAGSGKIGQLSVLDVATNSASWGGFLYNEGLIDRIGANDVHSGASYFQNTAKIGGAIYNSGTITKLIGYSFSENKATAGNGGVVYNNGHIELLSGEGISETSIVENTASQDGGAIYNIGSGKIDLIQAAFRKNSAGRWGGAIGNENEITKIASSGFSGNTAVKGGGAILNVGHIGSIEASFTSNKTTGEHGGAIRNDSFGSIKGKIDSIIGDFISNSAVAGDGGAIYNAQSGTIGLIQAAFRENSAGIWGGAISNKNEITKIASSGFSDNTAVKSGGAILNVGHIGSIEASFTSNKTTGGHGGAIRNDRLYSQIGKIDSIVGDFVSNSAVAGGGGAVYNKWGKIGSLSGKFQNNTAGMKGGAIFNDTDGTINTIQSVFKENSAEDFGGAISNEGEITAIGSAAVLSNFQSNTAKNGGAIYNMEHIGSIKASFVSNTATENKGGAILNDVGWDGSIGKIDLISGDFIGNSAKNGGAIYNSSQSVIADLSGNFQNNTAGENGGAIYNGGTITITGLSKFSGNTAGGTSNALHNTGTVYLNGDNIVFDDAISGSGGILDLNGTKTAFNNIVSGNTVNLNNGVLSLGEQGTFDSSVNFVVNNGSLTMVDDGVAADHNLGNLTLNNNLEISVDADLNQALGDKLTATSVNNTTNTIQIKQINLVSDAGTHITEIVVAEDNLKDKVALSDGVNINADPSSNNTYLVVYQKDNGTLKFGINETLEAAVHFAEAKKAFVMSNDIKVDTNLGALTGDWLSVSGNGKTIDGDGKQGIGLSNGQTLTLNNVSLKGFSGAAVDNNGVLKINSDVDSVIDGQISGSGKIEVNGSGNILFNQDVAAKNFDFNSGNISLASGGELKNVENLTVDNGALNVGLQTVELQNAVFNDGSVVAITVNRDKNGLLQAENLRINGGTLKATLGQGVVDMHNQSKTLTLLASDNEFSNNFADTADNNMYRFEKDEKAGDYIVRLVKTAEDVSRENGGTENNVNEARAWVDGAHFEAGSVSADVADKLADLAQNDAAAFNDALTALAPSDAPLVLPSSQNHNTQIFNAVRQYLTETGKYRKYGLSSGDALSLNGISVWAQAMGGKSKLNKNHQVYGFKTDSYGMAAGVDKKLSSAVKAGLGYSYFYDDIKGFNRDTDANTHTAFVYAEYRPNKWFLNGMASYGWSRYDETKHVLGNDYKAKYDVNNMGLQATTGYTANVALVDIQPEVGLRYNHIRRDAYKDTAEQSVKAENMDILTSVAGVKVGSNLISCVGTRSVRWRPEARLAATYDIVSDKENSVVSLQNGSSYVVNGQRLNRFGVETGADVVFYLLPEMESTLGYEGQFRKDFQNHTGYVNLKYKF